MRLLDRYLLREFAAFSLLGVGTFIALFIVVDLFEKLDTFVDHNSPPATVMRYYLYSLPNTLTEILPIALLLGSLLGLSQLRKNNEVTAMQGSGQSPWRLARPLLITAFIVAIGQYAMNETIGPPSYVEQKRILAEDVKKQVAASRDSRTDVRLLGGGSRFFVAQFFNAESATLRQVSVQFLERPEIRERIDAEYATYRDGVWEFHDGYYRSFGDTAETVLPFTVYASSRMDERPQDFIRVKDDPFHMSMENLWTFAERVRQSGGEDQKHMTNFHIRASFPLANLIMVLLGTALSLRVVRGSNVALGFGISVSVGFAYFALLRMGQALGYNGTLPPMLAAWLGNLVFGGIGMFLFWRVTR